METLDPHFSLDGALASLVEHAANVIVVLDRAGVIRYINHTANGRPLEEVLGTHLDAWVTAEDAQRIHGVLDEVLREGEPRQFEVQVPEEVGGQCFVVHASPAMDGARIGGISLILHDITAQKDAEVRSAELAEDLRRSNLELEQFAYATSHDLKEPLRMITSFAELLLRDYGTTLHGEALESLHFVRDGAKRMSALIHDLLTYARVGRVAVTRTRFSMSDAVDQVIFDLGIAIAERGAKVTRGELPEIEGESPQIQRVLLNLIENAIKFADHAAPRVHISAARDGEMWRFEVSDNGIGVEPEYAERIFLPFQRLHDRSRFEGTGLGLAIARKIIELHGGTLGVSPNLGGGSVFAFTLPAPEGRPRKKTR